MANGLPNLPNTFPARLQQLVDSLQYGFDPAMGHNACCGAWEYFPEDPSIREAMAHYWSTVPGATAEQLDAIRSFPPNDLIALKRAMLPILREAHGEYWNRCWAGGPGPLPPPQPTIRPIFEGIPGDSPGIEFNGGNAGVLRVVFRAPQIV